MTTKRDPSKPLTEALRDGRRKIDEIMDRIHDAFGITDNTPRDLPDASEDEPDDEDAGASASEPSSGSRGGAGADASVGDRGVDDAAGAGLSYESALRQIARLLKLSERAGSPEEAATAAAKAQVLMSRFQIEREVASASLEDKERKPDEPIAHFDDDDALASMGKQVPNWKWRLGASVARANSCVAFIGHRTTESKWISRRTGREHSERISDFSRRTIALIGRKSDVQAARYIFAYLLAEVERLVTEAPSGMGKTWRNNFRLGAVTAISRKLHQAKADAAEELRTKAEHDPVDPRNALVVVSNALKRREQIEEDAHDYGKKVLHLRSAGHGVGGAYDESGRMAGERAGSSINIGKARGGVGAGSKRINSGKKGNT